jgi:hypothetical protein
MLDAGWRILDVGYQMPGEENRCCSRLPSALAGEGKVRGTGLTGQYNSFNNLSYVFVDKL